MGLMVASPINYKGSSISEQDTQQSQLLCVNTGVSTTPKESSCEKRGSGEITLCLERAFV